jgi:hypothetical protein
MRSPTTSDLSGSDANREETKRLFDDFLKEEFDDMTDNEENNEAIKLVATH